MSLAANNPVSPVSDVATRYGVGLSRTEIIPRIVDDLIRFRDESDALYRMIIVTLNGLLDRNLTHASISYIVGSIYRLKADQPKEFDHLAELVAAAAADAGFPVPEPPTRQGAA